MKQDTHQTLVTKLLGREVLVVHNSEIRKKKCIKILTTSEIHKDGDTLDSTIILADIGQFPLKRIFLTKDELVNTLIDTL